MMNSYLPPILILTFSLLSGVEVFAQSGGYDNRQEYVRSSSPTKNGGRVISENVGGRKMVRIARASGSANRADRSSTANVSARNNVDRTPETNQRKYDYPEQAESEQVTAFRQAANQPPQLRFPQPNRMAQCNCNGVPVPPQQLGYFPQNNGFAGFQPQQGFQPQNLQPQTGFQPPSGAAGYPLQPGLGVPQFNQTGGNWWTPFISGSGYYTPLLNFRNMPQGTYLGQGIIGQPTAYVDGQPLRNLLRYISP